ncbi:MAG: hypothetical protein DRO39_05050 [Thermoprotei archaeon]|nr:MAG: hypothetical protein DRO39_05050 [Thermoprotei archaeon]
MGKRPSEIVEEMCRGLGGRITRTRNGDVECTLTIKHDDISPEGVIDEDLGSFKVYLFDHYRGIFADELSEEVIRNKDKYNYFVVVDLETERAVFPIPKDVDIEFDFDWLHGALHEANVFLGKNTQVATDVFVSSDEPRRITIRSEDAFKSIRIWLD